MTAHSSLVRPAHLGIFAVLSLAAGSALAQNPPPPPVPGAPAPAAGAVGQPAPAVPPSAPAVAAPMAPPDQAEAGPAAGAAPAHMEASAPGATAFQSSTATVLPDPRSAAAAEPVPEPEVPTKLKVADEGYFEPGALLQIWAYGAHQDETRTQFRIRRAELRVSGAILPDLLKYKVMIDPAKVLEFNEETLEVTGTDSDGNPITGEVEADQPASAVSVFQDVAVTWVSDYADVSLGQFKNPLSYEGSGSSSKLLFPERAAVSRYYGDKRDIGVQAEKKFDFMRYALGVFNGQGLNRADSNNQKDVALRLELFPVKGLLVGGVGYTSVGEREEPTTKDRVEGDVRLDMANVVVQAEYLHGWDGSSDAARTEGHGFYGAAAYTIADAVQPVLRIGYLDPNLDADGAAGDRADEAMVYELGVNYFVAKDFAKVQLSGSLFDYDDSDDLTEVILSTQLSY